MLVDKHDKPIVQRSRAERLTGERPPSKFPLFLFILVSLALFILVPYFIFRPQESVYQLKTYQAATVEKNTYLISAP